MSALNIVKQRDRVVVVTDGAAYDSESGVVGAFPTKTIAVPSWPGAVICRGDPLAAPLFAYFLGFRFSYFDSLVSGILKVLPEIRDDVRRVDGNTADQTVIVAGWSRDRDRPEAYWIVGKVGKFAPAGNVEERADDTNIQPP